MMAFALLKFLGFLCLVATAFSKNYGLSERNGERKTKSFFVLLTDFCDWISWFLKSIFDNFYFVFNTITQAILRIVSTIVSIPQKVINLIEFVGYCVRFSLQANYNFVSSVISIIRRFVENCLMFTRDIIISTLKTFKSLFNMILGFCHHFVHSFPKLYGFAGFGAQSSFNAAGTLASKTNSTFRAVLSSIGAVLELFGQTIVTTVMIIADLVTHVLLSCVKFFQFIGRTIISLVVCAYRGIVAMCQRTGGIVSTSTWYITDNIYSLCEQTMQFIQFAFIKIHNIAKGILHVGLLVVKSSSIIFQGIKHVCSNLNYIFWQTYYIMQNLMLTVISALKQTDVSYMFASLLLALVVCSLFIVMKMHVINAGFVFLETKLQGVMMRFLTTTHSEPISNQGLRSHDMNLGPPDNDVHHLQKQLQHERDKNLCVICQDKLKKVLLLPCRHMCICLACANYIMSTFQRHRRACPLCRSRIDSTVEVYS